jgi:hypothetical protein
MTVGVGGIAESCGATGPPLSRYSEDERSWESRPCESALIALVHDAVKQIERLQGSDSFGR